MELVNITQLLATYITALHILHYHGILDSYGHMSLRNPADPSTFYMFHTVGPALVSSPRDIALYRVSDAEPAEPGGPSGFVERFIHSALLGRYPGLNIVLHGHAPVLVSYSISGVPLRAAMHTAGFLGQNVPVFDISRHYLPNDTQDLLVRNARLGAALAAEFGFDDGNNTSSSSSPNEGRPDTDMPAHSLVLMRGHGFASCGRTLEEVVYQAVYARANADVESEALGLSRHAHGDGAADPTASDDSEHGRAAEGGEIRYLTPQEARDTWATLRTQLSRPWGLWERQVRVDPLYVNELSP